LLPLILVVQRSEDLVSPLEEIRRKVQSSDDRSPDALLHSFKQQLEYYASSTWVKRGIQTVKMQDGSLEQMYVTRKNRVQLFESLLSRLFASSEQFVDFNKKHDTGRRGWTTAAVRAASDGLPSPALQSAGGSNRFLGITVREGKLYSVGKSTENVNQ